VTAFGDVSVTGLPRRVATAVSRSKGNRSDRQADLGRHDGGYLRHPAERWSVIRVCTRWSTSIRGRLP